MPRYLPGLAILLLSLIVSATGCDSLVGWGELGEQVSAGPYRITLPKRFKHDAKKSGSTPGETKFVYTGPVSGKSEPGIVISYGPHHLDLSRAEPNWSEAERAGMRVLRSRFSDFDYQAGSVTTLNGLPAMRIEFHGRFTHNGETRDVRGIAYLCTDDTNLIFAIGVDFGPKAAEHVTRLENSLRTISRPGFTASYAWLHGGSASPGPGGQTAGSGNVGSGPPGYPGGAAGIGPPGPPGTTPGGDSFTSPGTPAGTRGSGYPGSSPLDPGSLSGAGPPSHPGSRPGSGYPGSSPGYPGSRPPGAGMSGFPGGPPGSGYPGSSPGYPGSQPRPGMPGYAGSRPGAGMAGVPGRPPSGYPGQSPAYAGRSGPPGSRGGSAGPSSPPSDPETTRRLAIARDPSNPAYFQTNLEMLQGSDETLQRLAASEMAKANPSDVGDSEMRKQIARALRDVATNEGIASWTRKEAVPALVVWGSTYSVPILIDLLATGDAAVKGEVIRQLTRLNDATGMEAVTMVFVQEATLRDEAAAYLRQCGPAAEDPVLKLARPTDFIITRATVQLLGDIGTRKSLEPLRSLRRLNFYRLVDEDVRLATQKIRLRMAQEGDAAEEPGDDKDG